MIWRDRIGAGLVALVAFGVGLSVVPASARAASYSFQTIDNNADPTFNQLLGINNTGVIAGYFGSGTPPATNPNKGYTLVPPYGQGNYTNENFPGSVQTQVTGLNSTGVTVGFYANANNDNLGFVRNGAAFTTVVDPLTPASVPGTPVVNQLLGVNDNNLAVGFYNDAGGAPHGYVYNLGSMAFTPITVAGAIGVTATGINNAGLVSGFFTDAGGVIHGFSENANGTNQQTFSGPAGALVTLFFGVNNAGLFAGIFADASAVQHGVVFNSVTNTYTTVDDPNGVGTTLINGLNDVGNLVGFYMDGNGLTHGFLASSGTSAVPEPGSVVMLGLGLAGVLGYARRRKSAA